MPKSVEFVPIRGSTNITIGGAQLPGTVELDETGGVNAPTKRTEEGYDYTTRVNREAREATITGWAASGDIAGLKRLRSENEPFAVSAGIVLLERAVLEDLRTTRPEDTKMGAVKVEVTVREAFQAQSGTSTVQAFASSGKKSQGMINMFGTEVDTSDFSYT
jgi:hypothetical protein